MVCKNGSINAIMLNEAHVESAKIMIQKVIINE